MTNFDPRSAPLAEIEELGELKRRYGIYDSATLRRWAAGRERPAPLERDHPSSCVG